jgi:hypothetical protein
VYRRVRSRWWWRLGPEREVEDIAGRILADRAQTGQAFAIMG